MPHAMPALPARDLTLVFVCFSYAFLARGVGQQMRLNQNVNDEGLLLVRCDLVKSVAKSVSGKFHILAGDHVAINGRQRFCVLRVNGRHS